MDEGERAHLSRIERAGPSLDALEAYATWLEANAGVEQALKAQYIRLSLRVVTARRGLQALRNRLEAVSTKLDSRWLPIVSRAPIYGCGLKPRRSGGDRFRFDLVCTRRWDELVPTAQENERFCDGCQHTVHYCATEGDASRRDQEGKCIAVEVMPPLAQRERLVVMGRRTLTKR